jgi:competence transcription factor ComK
MAKFVEIKDSNGKSQRTRYINPDQVSSIDASGVEHCLLHFGNGKALEINLPASKIVALFDGTYKPEVYD